MNLSSKQIDLRLPFVSTHFNYQNYLSVKHEAYIVPMGQKQT